MSTPPPRRVGGSTYCFTAVDVRVRVRVRVTPITKAPPAQMFFGWHVFCSPGHYRLISAMTFGVKVKLGERFLLL